MKHYFLFAALIFIGFSCKHQTKERAIAWNQTVVNTAIKTNTKVAGDIVNKQTPTIALIAEGLNDTTPIDANGHFAFQLPLAEAGYFLLKSDRATLRIFLEPGDELEVKFDQQDIFNTVEFKGKGSNPNIYLKSKYQLLLQQQKPLENLFEKPADAFKYLVDSLYVIQKMNLDAFLKTNPDQSPFFVKSEQAALFYDRVNQLNEYAVNSPKIDTRLDDPYFTYLEKTNPSDAGLLHVFEYRMFLESRLNLALKQKVGAYEFNVLDPMETAQKKLDLIAPITQNQAVADYLMHSVVLTYVRKRGFTDGTPIFTWFEQHCTDTLLKNPLINAWKKYLALNSQTKAPGVKFKNLDGNTFSFDDFKGQYIYVDIWASWCLPCRQEAPFFEALKDKYKAKNLVFVSLSIDESESDWRGFLQNRKVYDNQYLVLDLKKFADDYQVRTIPRFLLIDPEGNLIKSDAPRPSDKDTGWLDSLPGKRSI